LSFHAQPRLPVRATSRSRFFASRSLLLQGENGIRRRSFHQSLRRAKGSDLIRHLLNQLCKAHAFGGRHPAELHPAFLDACEFEKVFQESELSSRTVIACQVVAFSGMASAHQNPINPLLKAGEDEEGVHPSGARHADNAHIGRILDPARPRKIRPCIAAPVAEKSHNLRFPPFSHCCHPIEIRWMPEKRSRSKEHFV